MVRLQILYFLSNPSRDLRQVRDVRIPDQIGILALYHDQGLIPVKIITLNYSVNTTIGLPIIRTSPDHGTGFDIAGKGIANPVGQIWAGAKKSRSAR